MKKKAIVLILISSLILTACGQQPTQKQIKPLTQQYFQKLDKDYKKIEKDLKKLYTGEKLKKALKEQKKYFQSLKKLTGEKLNEAILTHIIIPKLQQIPENPKPCKEKDLNLYINCLAYKKVKIKNFIDKIQDEELKKTFLKIYYKKYYSNFTSKLLDKTTDNLKIEAKKKVIKALVNKRVIYKKQQCEKFPEKETKEYCNSLLNK